MKLESFYIESNARRKTRIKILEAAKELLCEYEFENVTMVDIANKCDITQRNLYRYYPNKNFLIIDVAYHVLTSQNIYNSCYFEKNKTLSGIDSLEKIIGSFLDYRKYDAIMLKNLKLIMKFDFYLNTLSSDDPAFLRYTKDYMVDYNITKRNDLRYAIELGIEDGTIELLKSEISLTVEYIIQSSNALLMRIFLKNKEREIFDFNLIDKHIEMIIRSLKSHNH